jgi:GNAT superfamily N-acetyltransferase
MNTRIRRADPGEASALTALTLRSKAHWGYDEAFMAAAYSDLEVSPAKLPEFHVYVLDDAAGRPLGYYALRPVDAGEVELDSLFVEPDCIGQGHGRVLWDDAVSRARSLGFSTMIFTSDPNAERFYLARGAVRIGEQESNALRGRMLPLMRYAL